MLQRLNSNNDIQNCETLFLDSPEELKYLQGINFVNIN